MTLQTSSIAERALTFFQGVLGRARTEAGRDIPRVDSALFARYANYFTRQTQALNAALVDGRITVEDWQAGMREATEQLNSTAYVIGRGGVGEMDAEDMAQLNRIVDRQLAFVDNWANELRTGGIPSGAALNARSDLYLSASNAALQNGTTQRLGLPNLPSFPGVGDTICRTRCACRWRIVRVEGDGNWNCFWLRTSDVESCETCISRERVWNPLQIRNGVIQPFDATGLFR